MWDAIIWCSSVAPHQGTRWPCCAGESSQLPASRHRQYLAWPSSAGKAWENTWKIHLKWIEMEAHGPSRRFKPKLFAFTLCSDGCWRSKEKFPLGLSDEDHVQAVGGKSLEGQVCCWINGAAMTISPHPQPQKSLIFSLDLTELLQHCDGPEAEPKWIYFRWMLTPSGDPSGSKYIMIPPGKKNESADPEIET